MMLCRDCEILSLDNITIDWRERSIKYARNTVGKCLKLDFIVDNNTIIFKNLIILFLTITSILTAIGRVKELRIFYKDYKTSYIEDDFLYKINTKNIGIIRSKICGNFASTLTSLY